MMYNTFDSHMGKNEGPIELNFTGSVEQNLTMPQRNYSEEAVRVVMDRLDYWRSERLLRIDFEQPFDARSLLFTVGIVPEKPNYYSSIASIDDIGGFDLMRMYYILQHVKDKQTAANFVALIMGMESLSVRDIIKNINAFAENNWQPLPQMPQQGTSNQRYIFGEIKRSTLRPQDQTPLIKQEFRIYLIAAQARHHP